MAGMPGPLARASIDAFRRHQAELERRRAAGIEPENFVGRPGLAESLIPIWGSGREAVADFQEGDYVGAGINGIAAASDLFVPVAAGMTAAKVVGKAAAKVAIKKEIGKRSVEALQGGLEALGKDIARVAKPTRQGGPPFATKGSSTS